jgi:outer membrane biogenesis lipoprotein LolB
MRFHKFLLAALAVVLLLGCEKEPTNELSVTKYQDQARQAAKKTNQQTAESMEQAKSLDPTPTATPIEPELQP